MTPERRSLVALLSGLLVVAALMNGLADAAAPAPSVPATQTLDSLTVERLSRTHAGIHPSELSTTTAVTDTVGSILAAELLLSPIDYSVSLPIILK